MVAKKDPASLSPRELDSVIALKVFGLTPKPYDDPNNYTTWNTLKPYSLHMDEAWRVVEAVRDLAKTLGAELEGSWFKLDVAGSGYVRAGFWIRPNNYCDKKKKYLFRGFCATAKGKTAPQAICLAALKALEVDV